MKALVTGGTGFIGSHLVDALIARGARVTVLTRFPRRKLPPDWPGVEIVKGDLANLEALRIASRGQDVIYHCAGLVAARNEAEFFAINRDGTERLLAAAAEGSRARFILVSSLSAAGPSPRGGRKQGHEPAEPVNSYGRSKLAAETVVRAGSLPWTIIRPPAVYGPRDKELLRVFKAVRFGLLPIFGDGNQELSMVYVADLVSAMIATGSSQAAVGKVLYPCHREVVTSTMFAREVAKAMGRRIRFVKLSRWFTSGVFGVTSTAARLARVTTMLAPDKIFELYAPAWTADPGVLETATGWKAEFDLARGVPETARWYRGAGWV